MAKKQTLPPDIESLTKAIDIFTKQGDRGTALIVAAWVDDALEAVIRSRFRPDKPLADDLLRPDGPLGSFSARIKLGYMLDLLEHLARKDLDLIRKIRNDFAHARTDLRFTTPSIRDRCRELHGAKACQAGGLMLRSPKQKFIATAYFLVKYVMSFSQPKKRNPLLEKTDAYGAWIRRTVKHASLELLARELKALEISPDESDLIDASMKLEQFLKEAVKQKRWFSYKSSYNREVLRRPVNRNALRILVEPIGIEPTTS